MDAFMRAPGYDLFKSIVAVVLLILALGLMWTGAPQPPASPSTPTAVPVSQTSSPPTPDPSEPTWTPFPPSTATNPIEQTPTPPPPPATDASEPSPTPLAPPTATLIARPPSTDVCQAVASRSRLQPGANATILRRLNFRSSPGIRDNWLLTNVPGTQVRIVGGPECVPYWTGAYLWWQVELPDGRVGWSAEGSLRGSFYFMEPR